MHELRFSFHDGAIEELCPDKEEPVWVLNFKRGVLSAFHNTMKRFDIDDENKEVLYLASNPYIILHTQLSFIFLSDFHKFNENFVKYLNLCQTRKR